MIFAFPHRSRELSGYAETIINLFGATHINFHACVIAFDHTIQHWVGSQHDVELTDFHEFLDLHTSHMDNIVVAVVHTANVCTQSTACKKTEPCN